MVFINWKCTKICENENILLFHHKGNSFWKIYKKFNIKFLLLFNSIFYLNISLRSDLALFPENCHILLKWKKILKKLIQRFLRSVSGTGTGRHRSAPVGTGRHRSAPALEVLAAPVPAPIGPGRPWPAPTGTGPAPPAPTGPDRHRPAPTGPGPALTGLISFVPFLV